MFPLVDPPLRIRAMEPGDAAFVRDCRIHPDNERYGGWRPATVEEVAEYARAQDSSSIGKVEGVVQAVIEERGQLVGDFGIQTREPLPTVELGLALAPEAKGRGLATRATCLLLDALMASGVHRVVARVDPRNQPSLSLFQRLGFRREGLERRCYWDAKYAEWTDEVLFAVLSDEWRQDSCRGS